MSERGQDRSTALIARARGTYATTAVASRRVVRPHDAHVHREVAAEAIAGHRQEHRNARVGQRTAA